MRFELETALAMELPVVPVLAQVFEATWREQGCEGALGTPAPRRGAAEPGQRVVKVLASPRRTCPEATTAPPEVVTVTVWLVWNCVALEPPKDVSSSSTVKVSA